ncbi:MAG: histidine phosphatase family protein [Clostridia bacterium]|nr:histidine phosphatase family protein [Clostridia bacterium]
MDITLIRHGRTDANERHLYCGATDLPLSEKGVAGLNALIASAEYPDITGMRIYTSGMRRADETLRAIYGDIQFKTISDMRELDFGRFEMHSYDELKEDADYIAWITDQSSSMPCPGGESSAQFKERVFAAFDELVSRGKSAMVVCHGGVIAELMARLFPDSGKNFYEWQPSAGRGYTVHFDDRKPTSYSHVPA